MNLKLFTTPKGKFIHILKYEDNPPFYNKNNNRLVSYCGVSCSNNSTTIVNLINFSFNTCIKFNYSFPKCIKEYELCDRCKNAYLKENKNA